MTQSRRAPAFASAQNATLSEDLLGKIVALRKLGDFFTHPYDGEAAAYCEVLLISDKGALENLGDHFIWWPKVRMAVAASTSEVPFIAGRFYGMDPDFRLQPLTQQETSLVHMGLSTLPE